MIVAYIDGGSRGNPGPAGFGVHIERGDGTAVEEIAESIGTATNNVAEYRGLIAALEWARQHGERELHVRSDSQLLVEQMRGVYKVRNPGLQPLHAKARLLVNEIGRVTFEHVARERNAMADRLANLAMDGKTIAASKPIEAAVSTPTAPQTASSTALRSSPARLLPADSPTPGAGERDATAPADPFTQTDRHVRLFIYRHFVETARAPEIGTIAAAIGIDRQTALDALRRLSEMHALVMAPASTNVWMAHPFSAVPTMYPVAHDGRTYWTNCAWDAVGVMSLVGGGDTRTRCADCAEPIAVAARGDEIVGDAVIHFAVPPRRFWDNIAYT